MEKDKTYWTTDHNTKEVNGHVSKIIKLCRIGQLRAIKMGRVWRIPREKI